MTKRQIILFTIPALIWGSTWYAIKFQLGRVDPLVSVSYRFILAGLILFVICVVTGKKMKFSLHEHFLMFLLGLGEIGPDRSVYIALITPVVAMVISTIFEDYQWNSFAFAGIAFLFAGNYFVLRFKTQKST